MIEDDRKSDDNEVSLIPHPVDWPWFAIMVSAVILGLATWGVWAAIHADQSWKYNCKAQGGHVVNVPTKNADATVCLDGDGRIIHV